MTLWHFSDRPGADALACRFVSLAAHVHAAAAELAQLASELELESDLWGDFKSAAGWISIHAGFSPSESRDLVAVGKALASLPQTAAAFKAGELSVVKVKALLPVIDAATEAVWLELARSMSPDQLARLCRESRRALDAGLPEREEDQLAHRGVWETYDDVTGMVRLSALLPPADGKLVMAALQAITGGKPVENARQLGSEAEVTDPALDPYAAARADALVAICQALQSEPLEHLMTKPAALQVVLHVDAGVVTGDDPEGRCHLENGSRVPSSEMLRILCDCDLSTVIEREGSALDLGRCGRLVSPRLRQAMRARDRGCRFPGCTASFWRTEAHHIVPWQKGGPTDLENLLSLCKLHHSRFHAGSFRIVKLGGGQVAFERSDGSRIGCVPLGTGRRGGPRRLRRRYADRGIGPETPTASSRGEKPDWELAIEGGVDLILRARGRPGSG